MKVVVWSTPYCVWCTRAKALLDSIGVPFEEKMVADNREEFLEVTNGAKTVPQIIIDGELIGGFEDLQNRLQAIQKA